MLSKNALLSNDYCLHITSKPAPNIIGSDYPFTVTANIRTACISLHGIVLPP